MLTIRASRGPIRSILSWGLVLSTLVLGSVGFSAEEPQESEAQKSEVQQESEERLNTLERAVEILAAEQDRLRTALAVPEDEELHINFYPVITATIVFP